MARTKHIYSSGNQIGHLWAHQTQDWARAGNVSFEGKNFSSYRTVVATICETPKGETVYLLTNYNYSVSTNRHQSIARRAIPNDARIFYVHVRRGSSGYYGYPEVTAVHEPNLRAWNKTIQETLKDAEQSREPKKSRLIMEAKDEHRQASEYRDLFEIDGSILAVFPYTSEQLSEIAAKRNAKRIALEARREIRYAAERAEAQRRWEADAPARAERERIAAMDAAELIVAWKAGLSAGNMWKLQNVPTMLRIKGDMVETSRGASFPVSHAVRGLALVDAVIARGEEWKRNGHTCHLGHYQIDRITADGTVYAGCHVVPFASIDEIRSSIVSSIACESEVA